MRQTYNITNKNKLDVKGQLPKQLFDPELRKAAKELEAIAEKYDCAAVCLFVSKTHSEFINHITPEWSVLRREGPNGIRLRSKKEMFSSKEEQHRVTEASAHLLTSVFEWSRQVHSNFGKILEALGAHLNIMWRVWDDKPDSTPDV